MIEEEQWSVDNPLDLRLVALQIPPQPLQSPDPVELASPGNQGRPTPFNQRANVNRNQPPANRIAARSITRSAFGLASVPFMIGDTGAGTCLSFGGLLDVTLSHPTLACSRLNISENNTPLPVNRMYLSYRHFHNVSPTRVFQFERDFNLDRFTLGGERKFYDGLFSFEVRLPLEGRLNSNLFTELKAPPLAPTAVTDPLAGGTFSEVQGLRRAELGNISMLLKGLLIQTETCAVSAGVGVTLPTAKDVNYGVDIIGPFTFPGTTIEADQDILLDVAISNETIYLSPFVSWLVKPTRRLFHQGFLQVEVAANPSNVRVMGDGYADFYDNNRTTYLGFVDWFVQFPGRAELFAQTLMRLNLGGGYIFYDQPRANWIQQLTGIVEVHYTSTLNDANITSVPIYDPFVVNPQNLTFGNQDNRVDIVNLVTGVSASMGPTVITHGCAVPLRKGSNRGFDFEYNLQVQHRF